MMQNPQSASPSILVVHPNCELYGSDRVLIETVAAIRARWPKAQLTILLPHPGVLMDHFAATEADVRAVNMWVPRRASLSRSVRTLPRLVWQIFGARRMMRRYDLTLINTVTPFPWLIASRVGSARVLIHVHEILTGHERKVFGALLAWTRGHYVFISRAVRDAFPEIANRAADLVWNGVRDFAVTPVPARDRLRLALVGRFNAWKGQGLLLDALHLLSPDERARVQVRLVGSAFAGAEHYLEAICARVTDEALGDIVEIHDFDPRPDAQYAWADVVVVPSVKPEPFGLVAIEAMASGRCVIGADHGGLSEIIVAGETGVRFAPGDAAAMAEAIRLYLNDRDLPAIHGRAARRRYEAEFRDSVYRARIGDVIERCLQA